MGFRSSYNNPVGMFAMGKKKIVKYENNNNNHAMSNVLQRKNTLVVVAATSIKFQSSILRFRNLERVKFP